VKRSALLICDVWDTHSCRNATERTAVLAAKIDRVARRARSRGHLVIHAPADTMAFYESALQRVRAASVVATCPPAEIDLREPPAPETKHSGCPDEPQCVAVDGPPWPWTRQHPAIEIADDDLVSDREDEIYNAISFFGVDRLAFAGVHTDICILDRPFGIRQMRRWGVECVLLRDLTEAFWPDETDAILRHIDTYLCPVKDSAEVFGSER
jgi:nicotinamidase-related amidase